MPLSTQGRGWQLRACSQALPIVQKMYAVTKPTDSLSHKNSLVELENVFSAKAVEAPDSKPLVNSGKTETFL